MKSQLKTCFNKVTKKGKYYLYIILLSDMLAVGQMYKNYDKEKNHY